jgi:ketosteroid isomerase-like protein
MVEVSSSGDMAYSFGPQQTTLNDEQGNSVTQRQKWSIVWRKQADGTWKCAFMTLDSDSGAATVPHG